MAKKTKDGPDLAEAPANDVAAPSGKAFRLLDKLRAAAAADNRPKFEDFDDLEATLGKLRLRRLQPEVRHKLKLELEAAGITAKVSKVDDSNVEAIARLVQRSLVHHDNAPVERKSSLLFPGDEGTAKVCELLTPAELVRAANKIFAFNEML